MSPYLGVFYYKFGWHESKLGLKHAFFIPKLSNLSRNSGRNLNILEYSILCRHIVKHCCGYIVASVFNLQIFVFSSTIMSHYI